MDADRAALAEENAALKAELNVDADALGRVLDVLSRR